MLNMAFLNHPIALSVIAFVIACLSASWIHPKILKVAKVKNITDNPDKRKLQREPVPVLGGIVVFFGIVMGLGLISPYYNCQDAFFMLTFIVLMLYTGTIDDIYGLTPKMRFAIEIVAAIAIIFLGGYQINSLHGLWGVYLIPSWISIPLTVVSVVGIINAINLIDGVNGLSSGFCMTACAIFGVYFYLTNDTAMTILAIVCIGALIPFFKHNVFGKNSRMFIGDGGTLMMGIILSMFVLRILHDDLSIKYNGNFGLVPFTLAVLAMPVFDTIRVMTMRILRKTSPFHPDKTHLHHAFIDFGFSHLATTLSILGLNILIITGWILLYLFNASVDCQLYFVIISGAICAIGTYAFIQRNLDSNKTANLK